MKLIVGIRLRVFSCESYAIFKIAIEHGRAAASASTFILGSVITI